MNILALSNTTLTNILHGMDKKCLEYGVCSSGACNFPICLIASLFASEQFYCATTNGKWEMVGGKCLVLRRVFRTTHNKSFLNSQNGILIE